MGFQKALAPHMHKDRPRAGLSELCLLFDFDNDIVACEPMQARYPDGFHPVLLTEMEVAELAISAINCLSGHELALVRLACNGAVEP